MTVPKNALPEPVQRSTIIRFVIVAAKLMVTAVILAVVLQFIDLQRLAERLRDVQLPLLAAAIAIVLAQNVLVALRWRLIVARLASRRISMGVALAIIMSGQFANQVMPFAAGDALRALLVAQTGISARVSITSVLIDRGIGMLALLLIAVPPLFLSDYMRAAPELSHALLAVIAVLLAGFVAALAASRFLAGLLSQYRVIRPAAAALEDLRSVILHPTTSFAVGVISLIIQFMGIMVVWILSHAVAVPIPIMTVWALVPPMLVATMFPFTVGGWGAREGVVVAFLAIGGIPPDGAFLLSLAFGATHLISSSPGAITWFGIVRPGAKRRD